MKSWRPRWQLFPVALISLAFGCGPEAVVIEGTITLDGEPLDGVQILFDQPGSASGQSFAGRSDSDGRYHLRPLTDNSEAEVEGVYRVTLTTAVPDREATEHSPVPAERIPRKYRGGNLVFEIKSRRTSDANFALETK